MVNKSQLQRMSAQTEAIAELVDQHDSALESWTTHRCQIETQGELDPHQMKALLRGYILWFAVLSDVLLRVLEQRSWNSLRSLVDKCITDGIAQARKNPTDPSGVPTLLSTAFSLNLMLTMMNDIISNTASLKGSELLQTDLAKGLQFEPRLLGSEKSQAIYDEMKEVSVVLAFSIAADVGEGSPKLNVDKPSVPPLDLFTGRSLAEKKLWRKLREGRAQLVSDYSGGSALLQVAQTLMVETDGRFTLEEETFRAVVGAGATDQKRQISGNWQIVLQGGAPHLQLQAGGRLLACWKSEPGPAGSHRLDGEPWKILN